MPQWWATNAGNRVGLYKDEDLHGPLAFTSASMFLALELVLDEPKRFVYARGQVGSCLTIRAGSPKRCLEQNSTGKNEAWVGILIAQLHISSTVSSFTDGLAELYSFLPIERKNLIR